MYINLNSSTLLVVVGSLYRPGKNMEYNVVARKKNWWNVIHMHVLWSGLLVLMS